MCSSGDLIRSSGSAATLLNIVNSYRASDVLEFTAKRKAADDARDGIIHSLNYTPVSTSDGLAEGGDGGENGDHRSRSGRPSSVIVVDSKMTPLEAATLLWENNM
jgi:hypothetical protein